MMLNLGSYKTVFFLIAASTACVSCMSSSDHSSNPKPEKQDLVCPSNSWVNCMPAPDTQRSFYCQPDVRKWVLKNCPGVEFAD